MGPGPEVPQASPTDGELVQRAKQGDRSAFDRLMERYEREVVSVAYRMLGHYDDAVDLAQEAFLRAYRGLARFRQEATFRTWVYQITLNLARHRRRWYARHHIARTVSLEAPVTDLEDDPVADRIPTKNPGPREEVSAREFQEAVRRALDRLPLAFKTVVVLRDIRGLPYEEIALVCGERIGTVKSRLHRARAMLRGILGGTER